MIEQLNWTGKVKKVNKWVPHEQTTNKKKDHFELSSFSLQQQWTIPWSDCDMRWKVGCIQQPANQLSGWTKKNSKALPKLKFAPKKVMVTVWMSTAGLIHYSFLNPSETIDAEKYAQQISKMHQKLQCLHLALVNRRDQFFSTARIVTQPRLQKLNDLGNEVLPHLLYSSDPSPANYHFFKHLNNFLQVKSFHNQQEEENGFQEFIESRSMDFYMTRINRLISH